MQKISIFSIVILLYVLILPSSTAALDESIFIEALEKAVDELIEAWTTNHAARIKHAIEKLILSESHLLGIGRSTRHTSYLVAVPPTVVRHPQTLAAYLFLMRKERLGLHPWPKHLFEGKEFTFTQKRR